MTAKVERAIDSSTRIIPALFVLSALSVFCVTPSPLRAQEGVAPPDVTAAIKGIITDQIAAFRVDDGERALSFAAPSIRTAFPTADVFMAMVRNGYAPVYRPGQVTFGLVKSAGDQAIQEVYVTDSAGEEWLATYTLARQSDGSWKITGCYLRRDTGSGA